jgi:hypothetical protein
MVAWWSVLLLAWAGLIAALWLALLGVMALDRLGMLHPGSGRRSGAKAGSVAVRPR